MTGGHLIVDGSNIATEGRTIPSLAQLDEAVRSYRGENPDTRVTVVVDATFIHRIPEAERTQFLEAEAHGEVVAPPAGAVGRGDGFLLRIADKTGASVLSNDSFQEFQGEHGWLFDEGRLIGGKPVKNIGWIFTPRTPVRARRKAVPKPAEAGVAEPAKQKRQTVKAKAVVEKAIATATQEAATGSRRKRREGTPPATVNSPLAFLTFLSEHPVGSEVEAEVESFTSHGAFVRVGDTRCYVPLAGLGDPAPTSARKVLSVGEQRRFTVQALDVPRRGVELALAEFAKPAGQPSEETVKAGMARQQPRVTKQTAQPARRVAASPKAAKKKAPARAKAAAPKAGAHTAGVAAKKAAARKGATEDTQAKASRAKVGAAKRSAAKSAKGSQPTSGGSKKR